MNRDILTRNGPSVAQVSDRSPRGWLLDERKAKMSEVYPILTVSVNMLTAGITAHLSIKPPRTKKINGQQSFLHLPTLWMSSDLHLSASRRVINLSFAQNRFVHQLAIFYCESQHGERARPLVARARSAAAWRHHGVRVLSLSGGRTAPPAVCGE